MSFPKTTIVSEDDRDPLLSYEKLSPLHVAVIKGDVETVSQLLRQGCDVNQELPSSGETPLHLAASEGNSLEVVKMLLEAGAVVNCCNKENRTPLMHACDKGHGSIASYLVRNGAEVNARNINGTTPLKCAIYANPLNVPLISDLLKAEASVNVRDSDGETPLHSIVGRPIFYDDAKWDVVELLLSYPCDVNTKEDLDGATPLLRAARLNDLKSALSLIKAGCEVGTEDRSGRRPMSLAIQYKFFRLVELLLAAGERIPREDWLDVKSLLESKDPAMLERLLAVGAECPKLSNMCRRVFYHHYGTQTRSRIDELPLPPLIKRYLTYEIL